MKDSYSSRLRLVLGNQKKLEAALNEAKASEAGHLTEKEDLKNKVAEFQQKLEGNYSMFLRNIGLVFVEYGSHTSYVDLNQGWRPWW